VWRAMEDNVGNATEVRLCSHLIACVTLFTWTVILCHTDLCNNIATYAVLFIYYSRPCTLTVFYLLR
jgi:hypothetical protein